MCLLQADSRTLLSEIPRRDQSITPPFPPPSLPCPQSTNSTPERRDASSHAPAVVKWRTLLEYYDPASPDPAGDGS
ncbi:hypothetical protein E2C01_078865 [Portunus trituberculatus]|uniref:Uncharacterized protein n=1 Tax=Portunus trituberculatus TaxID=210409 RepID=A0A5B7ITY0_PORTR|nr:hypothetical protein [Portunus trituberculatus]